MVKGLRQFFRDERSRAVASNESIERTTNDIDTVNFPDFIRADFEFPPEDAFAEFEHYSYPLQADQKSTILKTCEEYVRRNGRCAPMPLQACKELMEDCHRDMESLKSAVGGLASEGDYLAEAEELSKMYFPYLTSAFSFLGSPAAAQILRSVFDQGQDDLPTPSSVDRSHPPVQKLLHRATTLTYLLSSPLAHLASTSRSAEEEDPNYFGPTVLPPPSTMEFLEEGILALCRIARVIARAKFVAGLSEDISGQDSWKSSKSSPQLGAPVTPSELGAVSRCHDKLQNEQFPL